MGRRKSSSEDPPVALQQAKVKDGHAVLTRVALRAQQQLKERPRIRPIGGGDDGRDSNTVLCTTGRLRENLEVDCMFIEP